MCRVEWNLEVFSGFVGAGGGGGGRWGGRRTRRKSSEQLERTTTNNKLNPPIASERRESNPGRIGGRQVLSPLRHPCSIPLIRISDAMYDFRTDGQMDRWVTLRYVRKKLGTSSLPFSRARHSTVSFNPQTFALLNSVRKKVIKLR